MVKEIRLRSERDCIVELENFIKEVFENFELTPDLYPNVLISLTEAVNNAIKHGNLNDRKKIVRVRTYVHAESVKCTISDEGSGFDYDKVPDPTTPENIQQEGGRGVFLMKQLSDSIAFYDNGSTVEMVFTL